jgi:hypothetical protein
MKQLSYTLFGLSIGMVIMPLPVFLYLVTPYAESTRDPDAIEAPALFLGILLMLAGVIFFPVALGIWLHAQERYSGIARSTVSAAVPTSGRGSVVDV